MRTIRVVVVDDHRLVRSGICKVLSVEPDIAVVGEAADGQAAVELAASVQPDVVLMDIQMPILDGVAATRQIRTDVPGTQVLLLSTFNQDTYIAAGLKAGAVGYLLKDVEDEDLIKAIRAAAQGKSTLHPDVATKVIAEFVRGGPPLPSEAPASRLSERERAVLRLAAEGRTNREIAAAVHLAEGTVKQHLASSMAKLGARDRTQAVARAKDLHAI